MKGSTVTSSKSEEGQKSGQYPEEVETDDDWLTELEMSPNAEAESDAEIIAALGPSDPDVVPPVSVAQDATWLADFKALARKHRPFSTTQSARARMRVLVKRILRKHGYPPDLQDAAVQTVLRQAEALSASWAA
jgi:hypothetical protein